MEITLQTSEISIAVNFYVHVRAPLMGRGFRGIEDCG